MKEAYVSYEIAKLLKESGFNEKCEYCYAYFDDNDIRVLELRPNKKAQNLAENRYPCVTQQFAMAWLRENYNIFIQMHRDNQYYEGYGVEPVTEHDKKRGHKPEYFAIVLDALSVTKTYIRNESYEDAIDAAIKYCLENLI